MFITIPIGCGMVCRGMLSLANNRSTSYKKKKRKIAARFLTKMATLSKLTKTKSRKRGSSWNLRTLMVRGRLSRRKILQWNHSILPTKSTLYSRRPQWSSMKWSLEVLCPLRSPSHPIFCFSLILRRSTRLRRKMKPLVAANLSSQATPPRISPRSTTRT